MLHKILYRLLTIYWRIRKPVVLGVRVLAMREDEILLVRMTYVKDWYLPGGGVGAGETAREAAARELFEETGIRAKKLTFKGLYFSERRGLSDHIALFVADDFEAVPGARPDREIAEAGFFSISALPKGVSPSTLRRISEARVDGVPATDAW